MTNSEQARAIITSSYLLNLINYMLESKKSKKLSVIRFVQLLKSKTSQAQFLPYVAISDKAWRNTVNKYAEKRYSLEIEDALEFLALNEKEALVKMYGNNFETLLYRMLAKLEFDHPPKEIIAQSREIVNELTAQTKKIVYDYKDLINFKRVG